MLEFLDFAALNHGHSFFSGLADAARHGHSHGGITDALEHLRSHLDGFSDTVQHHLLGEDDGGADTGAGDTGGTDTASGSDTGAGGGHAMEEEHKQRLAEYAKSMEGMVDKKTEQVSTLYLMIGAPVAVLVLIFIIKLVLGLFTKTADKVTKGVSNATSKIKKSVVENVIENANNDAEKPPAKDANKSGRRKLLFGEIIMRFVNPTVTENEIGNAIAHQKESRKIKKIGEILTEMGCITQKQVEQALKIQDKSAPK